MSRGSKRITPESDGDGYGVGTAPANKRSRIASSAAAASRMAVNVGASGRVYENESTISAEDVSELGATDDEGNIVEHQAKARRDGQGDAQRGEITGGSDSDEEDELVEDEEDDELEDEAGDGTALLQEGEKNQSAQSMGAIERIDLTNFMCHKRLVIDLGPNVNFVIGHNGSGKSAILTAMTIALGAKAINTSRGSSIKAFVKEGEQAALIRLVMTNSGADAFKQEAYGDQIIIERTIRADGSGSWKIKSKGGHIVSQRREELDAICDHASIQADNPINILTQDASRQFLTSSDPQDKYDFFLRGSQLSQLEMEYDQIKRSIRQIEDLLKQKNEGMGDLEKRAKEAHGRYDIIKRARAQRGELEKLSHQMVWSQVKEKEDEFAKAVLRSERQRTQIGRIRAELKSSTAQVKELEDTIKRAEQNVNAFDAEVAPLHRKLDELRKRQKVQHNVIRGLTEDVATIDRQYKTAKTQLEDINDRIQEAEKAAAGDHRGRRLRLSNKRDQLKLECNKMQQEEIETRDRISEVDVELTKLKQQSQATIEHRNRLREGMSALEMHISTLRNAKNNHLSAYGPNMPKLLQLVQNERRWRGRVVGPVGSVVKIKDPQWTPVLESVIGNTLNAFCVTNFQDRQLLLQLQRQAHCLEVPILTGSDELFDYSSGEPDESILTVLRVLDIEDEFVKRQLINAISIERCALVQHRRDGDALMRSRPYNVKTAFSKDLFRLAYSDGSSTQTLQPYKGAPRLSSNVEEQLSEALARLPQEEQVVRAVEQDLQGFTNQIDQLQRDKHDLRGSLAEMQRQLRLKHRAREEVEEELREDEPTNVTALQASAREFEGETKKLLDEFTAKQEALDVAKEENEPLVQQRQEIESEVRDREEDRGRISDKLTEAAQNRVKAVHGRQHYQQKLEEAEAKLNDDMQPKEDVARQRVEEFTADAEKFCARVEVDKTADEYRALIKEMNAKISLAARQEGVDIEALSNEVRRTQETYLKAKSDIETYNFARRKLRDSLLLRIEKWHFFRQKITMRAKVLFSHFLSTRGYQGKLSFDHNRRRLSLVVKTDAALDQRGEKNPRSLSGGEKSYSTICLLLALWEAVGCPIRCLDEFDVFMDAVNRRVSMKLIMDVAKRMTSTQYVLITPQNISNIPQGPHVRIKRLQDPERNQTTLT